MNATVVDVRRFISPLVPLLLVPVVVVVAAVVVVVGLGMIMIHGK